jgi:hypothetical protein
LRRIAAALTALVVAASLLVLGPQPAGAALSNVGLVASNNQVSATGVTLTISFQVGVLATGLVATLPAGITGLSTTNTSVTTSSDGTTFTAPTLGAVPKLLSTSGRTVAVNLASALAVGSWVTMTITGLTNPGSAGDVTVTIGDTLLALADVAALDAAIGALAESANVVYSVVTQVTNGIANAVGVAPTLAFTVGGGTTARSWSLDPTGTASSTSQTETLNVVTNATSYTIQGSVSGHLVRAGTDGSNAKDRIEYNGASNVPHFGYRVTVPAGDSYPSGDNTTVRQWSTSPTALISGLSLSGLTNGEAVTITYDVLIDYTKAPGSYTGNVTYRVVPTY